MSLEAFAETFTEALAKLTGATAHEALEASDPSAEGPPVGARMVRHLRLRTDASLELEWLAPCGPPPVECSYEPRLEAPLGFIFRDEEPLRIAELLRHGHRLPERDLALGLLRSRVLKLEGLLGEQGEVGAVELLAAGSLGDQRLASRLVRALVEGQKEAWAIGVVSRDVWRLVGQRLAELADVRPALQTLAALRDTSRPGASERFMDYALFAIHEGYLAPPLAGVRLDGAELSGWRIAGRPGEPPLDLRGAVFRSARLEGARFENVDLEGSDFDDARVARGHFLSSRASRASFRRAELAHAVFRDCQLRDGHFEQASCAHTAWLDCRLDGASGLPSWAEEPLGRRPTTHAVARPPNLRLALFNGPIADAPSLAFSPDGKTLATVGLDGTVLLWDVERERCRLTLPQQGEGVLSCAFSPDGATLATTCGDGTTRLWSEATGQQLALFDVGPGNAWACAFSPDGRSLATTNGQVALWSAATGELRAVLPQSAGATFSCAYSPDGGSLAAAGGAGDFTLRLWSLPGLECRAVLSGHTAAVMACAFSPDGGALASASADGELRLWSTQSGACLNVRRGPAGPFSPAGCAFSPDGATVAVDASDGTLGLWPTTGGERRAVLRAPEVLRAGVYSPDGATLATAGGDGTVRLWSAATLEGRVLHRPEERWITACAVAPDGATLATAGFDGVARLWSTQSGACTAVLRGHEGKVWGCALSPDGATVGSAGDDGTVRLWASKGGACRAVLRGHDAAVFDCAFSPDGATLASAGDDGTVRRWSAVTGERLAVLVGHEQAVVSCVASPDGATLASSSCDDTVRLWSTQRGECRAVLGGHRGGVWRSAFSPDGALLASVDGDGALRLWSAATGERRVTIERAHPSLIWDCCFSPDGSTLVTAGDFGGLMLWSVAGLLSPDDGPAGASTALPSWVEADLLVEGDEDARAQLQRQWRLRLRGVLGRRHVKALRCAFAPDGTLYASGNDGSVRRWDPASLRELGWRLQFGARGWASVDLQENVIHQVHGDACEWLGWLAVEPSTGRLERSPAERLGPLPRGPA